MRGPATAGSIARVGWLEDLEREAARVLPPWVHAYAAGGAGDELSVAEAPAAWDRVRLRPRVLVDVSGVSTAATILGTPVATPVLVGPTALHRAVHPDGEAATAAGAAAAGSLLCLSSRSGTPVEEVAAAGGPWWMQVYVLRDRGATRAYVQRAAAAGAGALVLTGDTPVVGRKDADRIARAETVPPGWTTANLPAGSSTGDSIYQASDLGPDTIGWLREVSGLPVVVKGVLRADDAARCVAAGAAAVVVSNHGGRQLDGAVDSAVALPEVAAALAGTGAEVYVDGGLRRGSHVLRALAMGAHAVLIGRPVLWGLATGGAGGVRDVLEGLTRELVHAMQLAGAPTLAAVTSDLVHPGHAGRCLDN